MLKTKQNLSKAPIFQHTESPGPSQDMQFLRSESPSRISFPGLSSPVCHHLRKSWVRHCVSHKASGGLLLGIKAGTVFTQLQEVNSMVISGAYSKTWEILRCQFFLTHRAAVATSSQNVFEVSTFTFRSYVKNVSAISGAFHDISTKNFVSWHHHIFLFWWSLSTGLSCAPESMPRARWWHCRTREVNGSWDTYSFGHFCEVTLQGNLKRHISPNHSR